MNVLVPKRVTDVLRKELAAAGRREIGGVLVGEHVEGQTFRIVDLSVQRAGGSAVAFTRDPAQHRDFLKQFFEKTGRDYRRFNYIGEWHSHPSFPPVPSLADRAVMADIVVDPKVGAAFAVLIVAQLHWWWGLRLSVTAFRPGAEPQSVEATGEPGERNAGNFRSVPPLPAGKRRFINLL